MTDFVSRFTTFDKLIATGLIKVLYWVGIVFIGLCVLVGAFSGFKQGFIAGVGTIIVAPIGGLIMLLFWRFLCELYIVVFGMYNRLGEISAKLDKPAS